MPASDEVIKEQFNKLNQQFKYFKKNNKHTADFEQQFIELVNFYDKQNGQHTDKSYEQAYKLLVLFGRKDLKTAMDALTRYTKNFNFKDKKNYLDEIVNFSLPVCADKLDLPAWRVAIMKKGPQAAKLFDYATAIQNILGHTPKTFEEIKRAVVQIKYARFKENPELAELCYQYELSEDVFNRALEYKPNPIDNIPDVAISGTGDDERYHLVKLPYNDPHAYVLGKIVNCCQYIGGEGELPTREGIQYDTNGFYVLLKSKKDNEQEPPINDNGINYKKFDIVGQGLAWLNDGDNLTIDSWENLRDTDNPVAVRLLKDFGQQIIKKNPGIMRVTVGSGSKTPPECGDIVPFAESMSNGKQYNDSWQQRLLAVDQDRVDKIKEELGSAQFRLQAEKQFKHLKKPQENNYIYEPKFLEWRGSFLKTYVFNEDFYSSNNYSEWINGIFNNPKMQKSLNVLFKEEKTYSKFCSYLATRGPVVWKSLYMLSKNGFDLNEIFKCQFSGFRTPNIADIFMPLIELKQNGLLKHPMFQRGGRFEDYLQLFSDINTTKNLKNPAETPRALSNALIELHKHKKLFADKYVNLLFKSRHYEACAQGIIQLEKANLLDRYFELINKNDAVDVMRAVNNLHQYNILGKCEQVIRECSKNGHFALSNALIKLDQNGLLDAYLPFLEQYPDKANLAKVCNVLVNLYQAPEKTILGEDLHAFDNIDLIKAFKDLQNNHILTDKIQQLILLNIDHCQSLTEDLIHVKNDPEASNLKHPELADLYNHLVYKNDAPNNMDQDPLEAIVADTTTNLQVNHLISRPVVTQEILAPLDEQITIQEQPDEASMGQSTFSLRQFLVNFWQGLKNTVNNLVRIITSSSSDNTDELAQTDREHRSVVEAKDVKITCSYSRMANNIPLNGAGTAAIPELANNNATTNRTTAEPQLSAANDVDTVERDAHEEEPGIRPVL
ncbi:MAG: hypothetical protein P4L79_15265 [Legionella sp.]|uniref:hypothetical protein n=1 Tax=Legionella sp. TaxID=459 RepID=UPI00284B81BD|nr:hypothetical protein [Legionella sp.]